MSIRRTKDSITKLIDETFIINVVSPDIKIIPITPHTSPYPSNADKNLISNNSFILALKSGMRGEAVKPVNIKMLNTINLL